MHRRFCFFIIPIVFAFTAQAQNLEGIGKQKPFTFHGSITDNLILVHSIGLPDQSQPFSNIISGNFNASVYGLSLPFSFTLSNKQRDYSQPFNQFGLSPSYKWITIHAGYRNVRFSNFTLSGHTFAGVGIELNPGKFRFGFVSGRFNRSTSTNQYNPTIDSLPEYKRKGTAIKLGVGSNNSYMDLVLLRIQDDTASLKSNSGDYPNRTPEQNLVTGLNTRIALSKSLTFEGEGAVSFYTSNLYAARIGSSDSSLFQKLSKLILVNQSTLWYTAVRTSLNYKRKGFTTRLEFQRIDPGYKSLGAYYFNSDIENFTLSPSFSIWKRKIQLHGSIGLQRDNLRNTKKATTVRKIGSLALSFNPSRVFGMDAFYSNFNTNQKAGRLPVTDTTKVFQANQTFSLTPRLTFMNSSRTQMILLVLNRTHLTDNNPSTQNLIENTASTVNLNYMLSLVASKISLTAGLTYLEMKNALFENKTRGITAGISRSFANETLYLNLCNSFLFSNYAQTSGKIINTSLGVNFHLKKHHQFRMNTYFTGNYYPSGSSIHSSKQIKGDVGYSFTF
ncbi:MAG: hypothetical protein HXX13_09300 [Bacteroidetes bacterium]|nr:hypothetical protein [Bacteroidota bacterium]